MGITRTVPAPSAYPADSRARLQLSDGEGTVGAMAEPKRSSAPLALRAGRRPPTRRAIARMFEADLSGPVVAAGLRTGNPREISERVAMGRALWRELVIGFAGQLGELRLGFTQLAALYVLADAFSASARAKIEAAGGTASVIESELTKR